METDRLRYFCTIVETGSLTKAAEVLGVSHSGLSKAMSVLQDELGFRVFTPRGRGLELTDRGKDLYSQSLEILEMLGALKMGSSVVEAASVRVALPEALAFCASQSLIGEMKEGLTIEEFDSGEIEARILDRKVDFGFTFIPFPHRELDHLKVATTSLRSFARRSRFKGWNPAQIPYVAPSSELRDNPLSMKIRDGWNRELPRLTPYRCNSLLIALSMVQSGQCAIYAPTFLIKHLNGLQVKEQELAELELPASRRNQEHTRRDVFLVKPAAEEETKVMKRATRVLRRVCRE